MKAKGPTDKRLEEVLRIRIDGAQRWEVRGYIREREQGPTAAEPWTIAKGGHGLTDAEIDELSAAADLIVLESVEEDLANVLARQIAQRRASTLAPSEPESCPLPWPVCAMRPV